jgi:hypothetical protein
MVAGLKNYNMDIEINDGHYLELMDRLHIVSCTIDEHILNHPLCESNKDIQNKIDEALGLLMEAYQMTGNIIP